MLIRSSLGVLVSVLEVKCHGSRKNYIIRIINYLELSQYVETLALETGGCNRVQEDPGCNSDVGTKPRH